MIQLHGFSQSGNTFKVAFALQALGIVEKHLTGRRFFVGDAPTLADFSISGYLFYPTEESGYDFVSPKGPYPAIAPWCKRMKAVPGWADPYEMLPGEKLAPKW